MADDNAGILAEFEEFLNAKRQSDAEANAADDEEIEIWDEKGRGARIRRSRAKPFLQSLGIDLDPPDTSGDSDDNSDGDKSTKTVRKPGKQATNQTAGGVARKYFVKQTGK